ncbi:mechanosensitive ion channel family protein [Caminibacter pacificus]|jgi:small conductance mechanosensitive channel|uniref:Mechanosensitive ion channel n=1 Tax=Caminibacter pacificus TaxID=1424653 RepID=A0AAJ4RBK3_9BACT|nr:mechanosensitive ion channel domain-containing protein [Caminibacter pacificus]QCI27452.1 mechanosensitive ion channel [Caminibacter pacificus]ROR38889.1 small conductance mechanosensitive channel [Caminibacter pacificus]
MNQYLDLALTWGIKIIGAIAIYIIGKWIAKLLTNLFRKMLERSNTDVTLVKFLGDLVYFGLIVLVIIAALGTLGVNTTSFAAIIGAAGLAVGLALQGNIANFGAGVVLLFLRPFKVGDFVEAGGATGVVDQIGIFNTTFKTGDNRVIIVPNSNIIGGNITNYSREAIRRIDLVIGVGYEDDLKLVKSTLEEILANHPKVLKDPAPAVALAELADSSVNFNVRPWVKSEDYWGVRSELLEIIKTTFDEKGINIPYPQMDVHVDNKAA